jgi:hypothetical protein
MRLRLLKTRSELTAALCLAEKDKRVRAVRQAARQCREKVEPKTHHQPSSMHLTLAEQHLPSGFVELSCKQRQRLPRQAAVTHHT